MCEAVNAGKNSHPITHACEAFDMRQAKIFKTGEIKQPYTAFEPRSVLMKIQQRHYWRLLCTKLRKSLGIV